MIDLAKQCTDQVARYANLKRTWRIWLRGLLKSCIHNATGAVLAGLGTNGVEGLAPLALQEYVQGVGMNFSQCIAVFFVAICLSALKYVHATTAPGQTNHPFHDR